MIIYEEKRGYYESLKPSKIPNSWFAGDIIHYIFAESFIDDKKVLDAGCGLGYGSYHLSINGAREVVGIDISKKNIANANSQFTNKNLSFFPMDITKMSFDDKTFDIITNFEVIEHIPHFLMKPFMNEIVRVLKSEGKFIISTPNRNVYSLGSKISKTPGHINELSTQEFVELMKSYFKKCEFFYQFKYDRHELDFRKAERARIELAAKQLSWRNIIPNPIKKIVKHTLKMEKPSLNDDDLIEQMQLWSIKNAETIEDLDLSVIQIAVCNKST